MANAWEHVRRIGERAPAWKPRVALVTGAGPVGLLAALIGAQMGLDVHVLDRNDHGPKPKLVAALGAKFYTSLDDVPCPDVVIECTGAPGLIVDLFGRTAPDGIICLAGVSSGGRKFPLDIGNLNRSMVLENHVVFGSVNANRDHYAAAADALARADRDWLAGVITRRVPLKDWREAFTGRENDIKVVVDFTA